MKYLLLFYTCLTLNAHAMKIGEAQNIPAQSTMGNERSWCCGPNSLARFLTISGNQFGFDEHESLRHFTLNCPRSGGRPTTNEGYLSSLGLMGASLACLGYGWEGYSDIAVGVVLGGAGAAPFVIEYINQKCGAGKVGPTPKWLAGYANRFLNEHDVERSVEVEQFDKQEQLIASIKNHLLAESPVIALVNYSPLAWHYIVLIRHDAHQNRFSYLDTNGHIYPISEEKLVDLMDFHRQRTTKMLQKTLQSIGWPLSVDIGRFNMITWAE